MKNIGSFIIASMFLFACNSKQVKKETYLNGKIRSVYHINDTGKKDGFNLVYNQKGNKIEASNYKNGKLNGLMMSYFPSGKLEMTANYTNGLVDGIVIFYFQNGKIFSYQKYKNNVLTIQKLYYNNGKLKNGFSNLKFDSGGNTLVSFKKNGTLDLKGSNFVDIKSFSNKKIAFYLTAGFQLDTIKINIKKKFTDQQNIRSLKFTSVYSKKVSITLQESDFYQDRLNIEILDKSNKIRTYKLHGKKIRIYPGWGKYYIQLDKNETPKKYNLDFIE
jgi:hypothetical protein